MYIRWFAVLGLLPVVIPVAVAVANVQSKILSDASFKNWKGQLNQMTLSNNSTLSEYKAHTESQNTPGVFLQVGFIPRFNCVPRLSVAFESPATDQIRNSSVLDLTVDNVSVDFPTIMDSGHMDNGGQWREYAYSGDSRAQQGLRRILDNASSVNVFWQVSNQAPKVAYFSLLGSRLSVKAVEAQCKNHRPIP